MSRRKNFPEMLYVGMSRIDDTLIILDKNVADALVAIGERIASYERNVIGQYSMSGPAPLRGEPLTGPAVIRKTCLDGTATIPPEPDNQPSKATEANLPIVGAVSKTKKRHRRTKAEIQRAKEAVKDSSALIALAGKLDTLLEGLEASPELQQIVEEGLDDEAVVHFPIKNKKRHHRTKAEIRHQEEPDAPEQKDKPKWKCTVCSWEGDNPARIISGPYKNKYECPNCKAIAVKNE